MTERERLRELIYAWEYEENKVSIADCDTDKSFERLIDKLLANGVIVLDTDHVKTAIRRMTPKFVLCPKGWQGVRRTRYYCPVCKKPTRDHEKFCHSCGQAVKYPKLAHSKTENKLFLDWSEVK